jgi:hypothetical protein
LLDFIGPRCDVSHREIERVAELRVAVDEMFRQRLREGAVFGSSPSTASLPG